MMRTWKEFLSILPWELRRDVDRIGKDGLLELRLRINAPPELVLRKGVHWLSDPVSQEQLQFIINTASRYSPWSASSMAKGYLTAPGGHRIGVCGEVVYQNGVVSGIRTVQSLCIRIARDFSGIAPKAEHLTGSVLILGPPGAGKTTMLRDVIRVASQKQHICVVDERGELFPVGFHHGKSVDILTGCPKAIGIEMLLKTMGPDCIAVDEITSSHDCAALMDAVNCGVRLFATAHAESVQDLASRRIYQPLMDNSVFQTILVMNRDKTYAAERMTPCIISGSALY